MFDLGPFRGRFPSYLILTDRADNKLWVLQHTLDIPGPDGFGYVSISDVLPSFFAGSRVIYPAFEGPVIAGQPNVRLLVRSGMLGYEAETLPGYFTDRDQARILTRRENNKDTREIVLPTGAWVPGDTLAWTPIDFSQAVLPDPYAH
jgi:hypothetical protein